MIIRVPFSTQVSYVFCDAFTGMTAIGTGIFVNQQTLAEIQSWAVQPEDESSFMRAVHEAMRDED